MADTVNPNPEQVSEAAIPSTGKKRITAEAAKALQDYYASQKWGQNKKMPGNNVDKGLDDIIQRFGLERKQAAYQLLKWKMNTYDFYSWVPNHSADEIKTLVEDHMTMENDEFVIFTLSNMIPQVNCDEGCTSKSLYQLGSITAFGFGNKNNCKILISIVECKDDFLPMFSIVVNHYSVLASKHFPKVAKMIPGSLIAFALLLERTGISWPVEIGLPVFLRQSAGKKKPMQRPNGIPFYNKSLQTTGKKLLSQ